MRGNLPPYQARLRLEKRSPQQVAALILAIYPQHDWFDLMFRGLGPDKGLAVIKWLVRDDELLNEPTILRSVERLLSDSDSDSDLARILGRATPAVAATVLDKAWGPKAVLERIGLTDPAHVEAIIRHLGYDPRKH